MLRYHTTAVIQSQQSFDIVMYALNIHFEKMTIPIVQCLSDVEYFITYVQAADVFSYLNLENYWHKDSS